MAVFGIAYVVLQVLGRTSGSTRAERQRGCRATTWSVARRS
ncbi:MAG TPA: hypothetical protein VFR74_06820 [Jiangellales bacterium]|nr:hypothetical protein [Jiangellales bacterium]